MKLQGKGRKDYEHLKFQSDDLPISIYIQISKSIKPHLFNAE